jgi:hypothetical protein
MPSPPCATSGQTRGILAPDLMPRSDGSSANCGHGVICSTRSCSRPCRCCHGCARFSARLGGGSPASRSRLTPGSRCAGPRRRPGWPWRRRAAPALRPARDCSGRWPPGSGSSCSASRCGRAATLAARGGNATRTSAAAEYSTARSARNPGHGSSAGARRRAANGSASWTPTSLTRCCRRCGRPNWRKNSGQRCSMTASARLSCCPPGNWTSAPRRPRRTGP